MDERTAILVSVAGTERVGCVAGACCFSCFRVGETGEGRSVDLKTCVPRINESGEETLCWTLMSSTREAAVYNSVGEPHPKSSSSIWNKTVPFC